MQTAVDELEDVIRKRYPRAEFQVTRSQSGIRPKDKVLFRFEQGKVEITPARSSLQESYQSIPALKPRRSWREIEEQVGEEISQMAAEEGLE